MSKSESSVITWAKKPQVILAIGSFCIALFMIDYYTKEYNLPIFRNIASLLANSAPAIEYAGFLVGVYSFTNRNIRNAVRRGRDWIPGLLNVVVIFTYIFAFVFGGKYESPIYLFFELNVRAIISRAGSTLTNFILIAACWRALKFRSLSHTIAIIGAVISILYQTSIGPMVWPGIVPIGKWLNSNIINGVSSSLTIGAGIGSVILTLRILVGNELGMYGIRRERKGGKN